MKNQRTEHPVGEIRLMQALKQRTQRVKLNLTGARGALWCHIQKTFLDVDQRQEAGDKIQNKTDEGIKNLTKPAKNMPTETGLENSGTKPLQLAVFPLLVQACVTFQLRAFSRQKKNGQQETFNYVSQTFFSFCVMCTGKAAMQSNL